VGARGELGAKIRESDSRLRGEVERAAIDAHDAYAIALLQAGRGRLRPASALL
jgi:hypothetical protein